MLGRDLRHALDPVALAVDVGVVPDAWQERALRSDARNQLWLCTRQGGKSTTAAIKALSIALYQSSSLVLLGSPALRQSIELFAKVQSYRAALGEGIEAEQESVTSLRLANGSRIVAVPGNDRTVRGYSNVTAAILDEAARIDDELLTAILPMLAVSGGSIIALTTPFGMQGWFYREWSSGGPSWERYLVSARECPRISEEELARQLRILGPMKYRQEFELEFIDDDEAVFPSALIERALDASVAPLFR